MFDDDEDGAEDHPIHVPLQTEIINCMETPTHNNDHSNDGASNGSPSASPSVQGETLNTPSISRLESEHTAMSPDANSGNSGNHPSHRDTFNEYSNLTPHPTKGRGDSSLGLEGGEEDLGVSSTARNILDAHLSSISSGETSPSGDYNNNSNDNAVQMKQRDTAHATPKQDPDSADSAQHKRNLSLHHAHTHENEEAPHYMQVSARYVILKRLYLCVAGA